MEKFRFRDIFIYKSDPEMQELFQPIGLSAKGFINWFTGHYEWHYQNIEHGSDSSTAVVVDLILKTESAILKDLREWFLIFTPFASKMPEEKSNYELKGFESFCVNGDTPITTDGKSVSLNDYYLNDFSEFVHTVQVFDEVIFEPSYLDGLVQKLYIENPDYFLDDEFAIDPNEFISRFDKIDDLLCTVEMNNFKYHLLRNYDLLRRVHLKLHLNKQRKNRLAFNNSNDNVSVPNYHFDVIERNVVYFYSYSKMSDSSIIVSSFPIERGEANSIKTVLNPDFNKHNSNVPEYINYLNGRVLSIGIVSFQSVKVREFKMKMGDEMSNLAFTDKPVDWNTYQKIGKNSNEDHIKPFFRSFYWVD